MVNRNKSVPQSSAVQLQVNNNDQPKLQAIQGFDRTMPIFDQTLSVDRSLFQDLEVALQHKYSTKPGA